MSAWVAANPDVIGILLFVVLSIVARYAPRNSAFWSGVRSIVADYSQRNLSTLPANATARIAAGGQSIELLVGDKVVRRVAL